jgi:NAD(P)-dependent dehydrogenase (short-subunit alcohol dehydrogenase family)
MSGQGAGFGSIVCLLGKRLLPLNGVAALTEAIARYIKTDINKDTRSRPELKANFDFITSRIPMGSWGEPDDFKGVAVFMASDASAYMSGENIVIDGGYMAR